MPSQKLTEAVLKRMPKPAVRTDIRDIGATGLYVRVHPTGRKSWRFRYQFRGKPRVLNLGEWPAVDLSEARSTVLDHQASLSAGRDPAAAAQKARSARDQMPTVEEFIEEYIERHAKPNKRSWRADKRILNRDVEPYIGRMRLDEVHRRDLVSVVDRVRDRGANVMANRLYAVVRKMFAFAIERGILEASPAQYIRVTREQGRQVTLSDEALKHLWSATEPFDDPNEKALPAHHQMRIVLRLLALTGQRCSEVLGIRIEELALDKNQWTLPGDRTKNGISHVVPLSRSALNLIEDALSGSDGHFLFPSSGQSGHLTVWSVTSAMRQLFEGWEPRYTAHDLRRTVATRLGELGFNRLIQDKVLNHKDRTISGIYDRFDYLPEKQRALQVWAEELSSLVSGTKKNKIVQFVG